MKSLSMVTQLARADLGFKPRQSAPESLLLPDALNSLPVVCCEIHDKERRPLMPPTPGRFVPLLCIPSLYSRFEVSFFPVWCFCLKKGFCPSSSYQRISFPSRKKAGPGMI